MGEDKHDPQTRTLPTRRASGREGQPGHWKTTTLIAALDHQGIRCSNVIDGAINGDHFAAFVDKTLVPTLNPGDNVVLNNLSSHKRADAR